MQGGGDADTTDQGKEQLAEVGCFPSLSQLVRPKAAKPLHSDAPDLVLRVRVLHGCLVLSNLIHLSQDTLKAQGLKGDRAPRPGLLKSQATWNPTSFLLNT